LQLTARQHSSQVAQLPQLEFFRAPQLKAVVRFLSLAKGRLSMRRVQCTVLFVTVALFVCSGSAFACVCVGEPRKLSNDDVKAAIVKEFNDAAMVFSAEVLTQDTFQVKFRTITIWKGDAFQQLTLSTGAKKIGEAYVRVSSCDYRFKIGEKYLVYARIDDDYELVARSCTRTTLLADGQLDIPALDVLNPRAYRAPPPEVTRLDTCLLLG
jgi:hypothetical protein